LLGFLFLVIAAAFLLGAAKRVLASGSDAHGTDAKRTPQCPETGSDAPSRLRPGVLLALLFTTPKQVQFAWAFFMGFAIVFTVMEGPAALRDLWPSEEKRVEGEITRVEGLDQREFGRRVYEYEFRYELDGRMRTGKSHTVKQRYNVGDRVDIVLDPGRPDAATIADTRRRNMSWWVLAIPLGVLLLLSVGIVGNYAFNIRTLSLARKGLFATAARRPPGQVVDPNDPAAVRAAVSKYEFQVGEQTYLVDHRSWATGDAKTIPVLFAPKNPARNVGLDDRRWAMLVGVTSPWPLCVAGMIVPLACIAALVWLWGFG
jgi:hypothetical protein